MRREPLIAGILLAMAGALPSGQAQEPATQAPLAKDASSSAAAAPAAEADSPDEPLQVDLETAVSGVLARMLETPRFEEEIEVRDRYQEALDAHLKTAALGCQVARSGPPESHVELDRYGANPKPPSADLLTPAKLLFDKAKEAASGKEPRFFLYSVRREDAPDRVVYVVLDDRVSVNTRYSVPDTKWELLAEFSDRGKAEQAFDRVQRGKSATPDTDHEPPRTLWAATGCR